MKGTGENNKGNYLIYKNKEITDPQDQETLLPKYGKIY